MSLFTPHLLGLGLLAGLAFAQPAQAQQAPRYIFPNTQQGHVLALPNGQVLLASAATGSRVLRLHWLNAQGDTVRGQRVVIPGVSGVSVKSVTANPHTGTLLIDCGERAVLLSAPGDTLWTRPMALPPFLTGTPDGGFAGVEDDIHPTRSVLAPKWVKLSAAGQKVGEVFLPLPNAVDHAYSIGIVPAVNGCWAVAWDVNTAAPLTTRVVYISDAGVVGAEHTLSGVGLGNVVALPNPADGYLVRGSGGVQRFSPAWVPQWAAPVPSYDGIRMAPDGNALVFAAGPYVRTPNTPVSLGVAVGQITAQGQRLYASTVDQHPGYDGVGLDIAKNTAGSLIVHTVQRRMVGSSAASLLVYALPATPLATKKAATAAELAVYPQPATEAVTMGTAGLRGQLTLLDGLGRVVRQLPVEAGRAEQQLPLQGLPAGIYVLRATDAVGRSVAVRVSKQ